MRKVLLVSLLILGVGTFYFLKNRPQLKDSDYEPPKSQIPQEEIYQGVSYEANDPNQYEVKLLSSKLVSPTRIRLTPEGKHLLVSQITGELLAFNRTSNGFFDSPYLVTHVETKFPGFPPDEAGLVGITLSKNFEKNGKVFLLYTYKDESGATQNRISVTTLSSSNGKLSGSNPKLIYEANIPGTGSHQITDGVSLRIQGKQHLLVLIGEGFDGKRAQDPSKEGGKVILIQEDGSDPLGPRPYSENPKVEALGIRNAYVITRNPNDPEQRILIADTGPDKYDRLIYTKLGTGLDLKPLNFGWNGDQEKLKNPIPDPNNPSVSDMVIFRLPETRTFTGLTFLPGENKLLATVFGETGSPQNSPGKEIWIGELTNLSAQPKVSFKPIIRRVKEASGKLGNPIGLEVDPQTGNFFFADILEGRLYQVSLKGGDKYE